ncbi:MAG: hypothetical protein SNJ71_06485, partial [Bacteroidales bacterium]
MQEYSNISDDDLIKAAFVEQDAALLRQQLAMDLADYKAPANNTLWYYAAGISAVVLIVGLIYLLFPTSQTNVTKEASNTVIESKIATQEAVKE